MKFVAVIFVVLLSGCAAPRPRPDAQKTRSAALLVDEGVSYLREGKLERARAAFEVSFSIAPSAEAIDGLGCVAMRAKDTRSAERLFRYAAGLEPNYSQALANLALLLENTGRKKEAEEFYRKAIELDPRNYRARNNFAVFLTASEADRPQAARGEILRAAALSPDAIITSNVNVMLEEDR